METEIRRLPKKTIFFMFTIIILGVLTYFLVANGQSTKVTEILNTLGYKNVTDVQVYANHQFIRDDINVKGYKYTISFINLDTNEECKGFVLKDFKRNVDKDLLCTKIK